MNRGNVVELFRSRAAEFSGRTAIERAGQCVTYGELDARSDALAAYLTAAGATKGAVVAVLAEEPVAAITAILGIVKAACVFVPLDPGMPEKRLAPMVSLVAPQWFVVDEPRFSALAQSLAGGVKAKIVSTREAAPTGDIGRGGRLIQDAFTDARLPAPQSAPDDMCYVYFTSGSTGSPKGIAGRLKGIDHFIRWEIETLGVGPGTRVSQLLPYSFDGSLRDIFVPLCAGGTVCVPPTRETILDARSLIEWIDGQGVSIIHCIPSLFRAIVNEPLRPELFPALRHILMAGEPLLPSDVKRWVDVFGERVQLVNLYGTSETTMAKFTYFVKASDAGRRSIPIGKPMPGAAAVVVDTRGRPCPTGVIGEIYIRTPYRSLGYYGQPELTREVFVPNPFSADPEDIVYKTGDLGRVLEDGNFEYLGRQDQQVKIRGNRVELEEVESLLRGHAAVKDVAVADREDASGYKYLCAYVVLDDQDATAGLREYAASSLPDFMVPSAFVQMNELPRTISGKVDRRALAALGQPQAVSEQPFSPPRNPVEELICNVWSQVLGLSRVGVFDNFFHSGGHSLSATQVVSRLRDALGVEITLRDLFQAPTVEALALRVLAAQQSAAEVQSETPVAPALCALPRDGAPPLLSFAQQRLWFLHQLEPESAAYNIASAIRLRGALAVEALERSLGEVVRRHEALRTTFEEAEGQPVQVIHEPRSWSLPVVDLSDVDAAAREERLHAIAAAEAGRPFDLKKGPTLRTTLLRLSADEHALLLTMHHIVSDGWSMGVLVRELVRLYEAYVQGEGSPLAELPIQYADYAAWQRGWLRGEALESQLSYWRGHLAGAPPQLELPTDRRRSAVQSSRGGTLRWQSDKALSEGLKRLSREEGATLFMVLLAGFAALLSRHAGQEEVVIGAPIAGRTRAETEGLIGFFVNTLALRVGLGGDPSFRELVGRAREVTLGAYAHQDIPFEKLVEELRPERSLSQTPLFQVMLDLRTDESETVNLTGLSLQAIVLEWQAAKFEILLDVVEAKDGTLSGVIEYNSDVFEGETMERMLGHWLRLLTAAGADPGLRLSQLPLLTEAEGEQLEGWNRTAEAWASGPPLHELFEGQAARTPDAAAVVFAGGQLTYAELNARANRFARSLVEEGAAPETLVALLMERNADLLAAILGVFKAGCAYLPLDPRHPAARHGQVLTQSRVGFVVNAEEFTPVLSQALDGRPQVERPKLLPVKELLRREQRGENLALPSAPGALAYVIYTSGSTGEPKGAMVEHEGMLNHLWAKVTDLGLTQSDSVAQTASQCFDISVWQFLAPLLVGGRTHVVGDELVRDPARLLGEVQSVGVTILEVVPSLLRAALDNLAILQTEHDLSGLRLLILTGEALPPDLCRQWFDAHPEIPLLNAYGPTECSDDVTHHFITHPPDEEAANVPIGRPISNTQIYILDGALRRVPVGARGELYVGGVGVGRGYLNEPGLTAEAFVPDPFGETPGGRLYATGDIARFRLGGVIEYLGRADGQVKVRGFRIEPGDVEAALNAHDGVREGVVIPVRDAQGDTHLVAYVVAEAGPELVADGLRDFLRERLPDYMTPSAFVTLGEMPLTPNGKIDRRALPTPDPASLLRLAAYAAPSTETEKAQAVIWADVLRLERVGVDDNFFDLGGHSLVATQLVSRLRMSFGVEITLADFFADATVRAVSERIELALVAEANSAELGELLDMLEALESHEADDLLIADDVSGQSH